MRSVLCVTLVGQLLATAALAAQRGPDDPVTGARAAIARGAYAEAEALLRPAAEERTSHGAILELGLLLQYLGRRAEASRWLETAVSWPAQDVADLVRAGRAAHALGEFRLANGAFQDAADRAPDDVALNVAWGELFLQAHDRAEAAQSFQMAIERDDENPAAYTGLAAALTEDAPPDALKAVQYALELDPSYIPAHLLLAELALDRGERERATEAIDRVLDINPSSLEGHALRGAVAYLEDRVADFEREVDFVRSINPVYGDVYRAAGSLAARNYRFEEAVALTRRALELDPDNVVARAELGMHLLRTGDEADARRVLEQAFEIDPYNQITFNLLNMMDTLDTFSTVQEGKVVLRLDPEEEAVIREYAMPLAQRALAELSARYGVIVEGPILVEIFPKHDDFAVRNLGLPGMIGALGACFGRVVTLDSPRARPPGTFNWGATLWHELAHVITLQMSNQRVPRWLTEGISVYEEKQADPRWGREMDLTFAQVMASDGVLPLEELNAGFTDGRTISLAYHEASLLVEHIVATYGEDALYRLVRIYATGLEGDEALESALGVTMADLQGAFDRTLDGTFGDVVAALHVPPGLREAGEDLNLVGRLAEANPGSYPAQVMHGRLLWGRGDRAGALAAFERAADLVPIATGRESPNALRAAIALEEGDSDLAIRALEALLVYDHQDVESARLLVRLLDESGAADSDRMVRALDTVVGVDPFDPAAHTRLGRLLLERGAYERAVQAFRVSLAAGAVDRAAVHVDLAEAYLGNGQPNLARRETLAAMEIAPSYQRAQDMLLDLIDHATPPSAPQ